MNLKINEKKTNKNSLDVTDQQCPGKKCCFRTEVKDNNAWIVKLSRKQTVNGITQNEKLRKINCFSNKFMLLQEEKTYIVCTLESDLWRVKVAKIFYHQPNNVYNC